MSVCLFVCACVSVCVCVFYVGAVVMTIDGWKKTTDSSSGGGGGGCWHGPVWRFSFFCVSWFCFRRVLPSWPRRLWARQFSLRQPITINHQSIDQSFESIKQFVAIRQPINLSIDRFKQVTNQSIHRQSTNQPIESTDQPIEYVISAHSDTPPPPPIPKPNNIINNINTY